VALLLQYGFIARIIPFNIKQKKRPRSIAHSCWLQRDLSCTDKGFAKGARVKRQGNGDKGKGPTLEKAKSAWLALLSVADMLPLFQLKRPQPPAAEPTPEPELPKGWLRSEPAATLLATPRRQKLLEHIWQRTSLSRQQFNTLYLAPLHRYAELVQQFPASESHHHAYPGGMLDHGLEIVAYALKLRQSHLLPAGASPEDQAAQSEAWTAATAYAALLHDIGKIAVDIQIELIDGSTWHPWHGTLQQPLPLITPISGHRCCTYWTVNMNTRVSWANSSSRPTAPPWRRNSAATPPAHWPRPRAPATQTAGRPALPAQARTEAEPTPSLGRLAHRRCPMAGQQNRAVSNLKCNTPCRQHGRSPCPLVSYP